MTTKNTTKAAAVKKPAEKKPVVKKVGVKPATEKKAVKNAAVKAVLPAPRTEGNPVAKKQPKPVFSIFDETAKKFVPAEGAKPITIPGLEAFQLFIHQTKDGRNWCVSEACSGGRLAIGSKRAVAVQMATEMLNKHGKAGILESIQRSINRSGAAPGFTPPAGIQDPADVKAEESNPKQIFKITTEDGTEIEVTYDESMQHHLEFRGELSPTGYHSHFGYDGKGDVREAAQKLANEFRAAFLKEQAKLARKQKAVTPGAEPAAKPASRRGRKPDGRCPTGNDNDAQIATGASHPSCTKKNARRGSRSSQLDIAAAILKDAGEPLTCKEMVRRMLEGRLWESGGRTPGATLSASINREIAKLGKEARFVRAERGLYSLKP